MFNHFVLRFIAACLLLALGFGAENSHAQSLSISSPQQNVTVAGALTIAGYAPGYLNVEVWYDNSRLGAATPDSSGAFSITLSTSKLPTGSQTLTVHAWNSPAGQPFTLTQQLNLALLVHSATTAAPASGTMAIRVPTQNAVVAGQMTVSGSAPGFANVEVSFNGILLGRATPAASGAFKTTFSTLSLPDGAQTLVVNAWNSPAGQAYTVTTGRHLTVMVANGSVNITSYGAIGDGVTDNTAAILSAIAAAQSRGAAVFVPRGTFAYSTVLTLTGVKMFGIGPQSILYALNSANESIFMYGNGPQVRQLQLTGVTAPSRQAAWQATRITIFGATNFVIDNVTIQGSAAAGIQTAQGANYGIISNCTISNTLSDSIHITDQASFITVENNHVENSGDDGIAVVSYLTDGGFVHDVTATDNVVLNNLYGRTMSVVGGENILYENNELENNTGAACLYLAQEEGWNTFGLENVTAEYNTLVNCGNVADGHGAIMLLTSTPGAENVGVQLIRNDIEQPILAGIRVFGDNLNVVLDSNEVVGAVIALDVESPGVQVLPYVSGDVGYTAVANPPIP
jgi:hypothetical protein